MPIVVTGETNKELHRGIDLSPRKIRLIPLNLPHNKRALILKRPDPRLYQTRRNNVRFPQSIIIGKTTIWF